MLIKIDETVVNYIKTNSNIMSKTSKEIISLNNLAIASRDGTHVIISSVGVLEYLMKLELLDFSARKVFNTIFTRFSTLGSHQTLFNTIIIVKDPTFSIKRSVEKEQNIIEVPIDYFKHISSIGPTNMLCEDITDFHFYTKLAKKYINENQGKYNLPLTFNFINGGGDRSGDNYDLLLNTNDNISIAIADSDKKTPACTGGNTLSKLRTVFQKYESSKVTKLVGLAVREKENLIPPSLYNLCEKNSVLEDLIDKLRIIEESKKHTEKLFYMDIKDGIQAKISKNQEQMEYFKDMFEELPELIACTVEEIPALQDDDFLIRGIGTRLLDNFISNILEDGLELQLKTKLSIQGLDPEIIKKLEENVKLKNHLFKNIPEYIEPYILELCKTVIAWGCSTSQPNSIAG